MTREDIKKVWKLSSGGMEHRPLVRLINFIFDDIESRVCENCKCYISGGCFKLKDYIYPDYDVNDDTGFYITDYDVDKDFGCNKFERKQ